MLFPIVLYSLFALTSARDLPSIMPRVVGGSDIFIDQVPYQVAIFTDDSFTCGGSLITNNCVLTAAHCVNGRQVESLKIRAGVTYITRDLGERRTVELAVLPITYNPDPPRMDVAILRLNAPVSGPNISSVTLDDRQLRPGDLVRVTGWGLTSEYGRRVSNVLRVVTVKVVSWVRCWIKYGWELTDTMFCAGFPGGGRDSCAGDSGGPVVKDGKQVGIVSWGHGCGEAKYPGVYTSIKDVLPWVNEAKSRYCNDAEDSPDLDLVIAVKLF